MPAPSLRLVWILALAGGPLLAGREGRAAEPLPGTVYADSILATARVLSGETGLGPDHRVARWPATQVYAVYLRDRLQAVLGPLGGSAVLESFDPGFDDAPPDPVRFPYTNVVGRLPGVLPGSPGRFLLSAHFDATSGNEALSGPGWDPRTAPAPGADDNASGIAVILEALRAMADQGRRPQADLEILFFDGEEQQIVYDGSTGSYRPSGQSFLLGSTHRADSLAQAGTRIYGMVNADMLAYNPRQDSLVVVTNPSSRWLADHLVDIAGTLSQDLILTRLVLGLNFSDHGPFWLAGYDAVLLIESADIERHAAGHYHLSTDTVDRTYSRNGSQAARAAELLAGLLVQWSWTGEDSLSRLQITGEDILVRSGNPLDLQLVRVGMPLDVEVGVTNRGGTETGSWTVAARVEDFDGRLLEDLGTRAVTEAVPAGGRIRVTFPWTPSVSQRGAARVCAELTDPRGETREANRILAVEGDPQELARLFVFPNPTRDPTGAVIHYELSGRGSVRLTLVDLGGITLAERDLSYSRLDPLEGTLVGVAEVPLRDLLEGRSLAPGMYLLRAELFDPEKGSRNTAISRFVVIR